MKFVILDIINANFEIIILSESWIGLESTPINNFQINGYSTSKLNKSQNYIVIFYLKDTLIGISVIELNMHAQTSLEITFKIENVNFLIYALYKSPYSILDTAQNKINDLILNNLISKIASFKIIVGDINIHYKYI